MSSIKIAIASGKGGTGKTTLATNLASHLAEHRDVVLIDLDVEEPNSRLFLRCDQIHQQNIFKEVPQWSGDCSLCGQCQDICNFNALVQVATQVMVFPELCHSCRACSELCPESALPLVARKIGVLSKYQAGNLIFVESCLDIGEQQAVPLISQTKHFVEQNFDDNTIKIYDSPPGTSCPMVEAVKDADYVILVTEPTPFGMYDLKLAVEVIRKMQKAFGVVVNRYGLGNDDVIDYCQEEGIPILARIANDRRIAELYSAGELIYTNMPEFRQQLIKLEHQLELESMVAVL